MVFQEELRCFSRAIDAYPAAFQGNRLNLLFLDDACPIYNPQEYLRFFDELELQEERREFLIEDREEWPFPTIRMESHPDPWEISLLLFKHFSNVTTVLPTQRNIGTLLLNQAIQDKVDLVILFIVDGLSFYDLPDTIHAEPCFVNGVTTTAFGYSEVIGKPTVSQRFFSAGYRDQMALTFFDETGNPVSAKLHNAFGTSQVHRINTIEEGLKLLEKANIQHGYIQIAAPGLDRLCHYHADRPPYEEYLKQIMHRFQTVFDALSQSKRKIRICLTADHGIMWREQVEERTEVVHDLLPEDRGHPRYIKGSLLRGYTQVIRSGEQTYSLLQAPYLTRNWKHGEWGMHGGISAWESIVPIIIRGN